MDLLWMPAHAPYMPIATVGLLALLTEHEVTAYWSDDPSGAPALRVDTSLGVADVAQLIADAPWPQLERIKWPTGNWSQGLKPTLKTSGEPARAFRDLVASAPPLEQALLRAILTDGVLDNDGVPGRSRLLRGVKADLSSIAEPPRRITAEGLAAELHDGHRIP